MDKKYQSEAMENRELLKAIIKSAKFLSGLPFRGHRDSGPLNLDEPPKKVKEISDLF